MSDTRGKLVAIKIAKLLNDEYGLLNYIVAERGHENRFGHRYCVIQKNVYDHVISMRYRLGGEVLVEASDYVVTAIGAIKKARNEEFIRVNGDYIFNMNEMEKLLYG